MRQILLTDSAKVDLTDIWLYVAEDNPNRADSFIDEFYAKFESLAVSPGMGRPRDGLSANLMSFPLGNYLIFYRAGAQNLEIVRVVSGYRDIVTLFP